MTNAISPTSAQSPFGLDFQSLLQIILTQLTYQDPLKPMDNFQFVSQLAQFSQLEQTQTMTTAINNLLSAQTANEAVSLLGKTVTAQSSSSSQLSSGKVAAVTFANGVPTLTLTTSTGGKITGVDLNAITLVQ
jgi:flagellar basal-body rod modification protein FlgD